jgi:hypothetical protein
VLEKISEVVLLGGTLRSPPLAEEVGRSILELPVTLEHSVLEIWQEEVSRLSEFLGRDAFPVRLLLDRHSPEPRRPPRSERLVLHLSRDQTEYRGTAGILRDASIDCDADEFLLVANAAQLLLEPLEEVCERMANVGGDATVLSYDDGTPSGLMLIRRGCLRDIPPVGYIDMKEQALSQIAKTNDVRVVHSRRPVGLPLRTRGNYLEALHSYHRILNGALLSPSWSPSFALVEDPQDRKLGAKIHNSVVLRGGRVETGATVVRSIVCPGGVVPAETTVVNGLIDARVPW